MNNMTRVSIPNRAKKGHVIHIETDLGLINIFCRLEDAEGRRVERIEIVSDQMAGDPRVGIDGDMTQQVRAVRLVEERRPK